MAEALVHKHIGPRLEKVHVPLGGDMEKIVHKVQAVDQRCCG